VIGARTTFMLPPPQGDTGPPLPALVSGPSFDSFTDSSSHLSPASSIPARCQKTPRVTPTAGCTSVAKEKMRGTRHWAEQPHTTLGCELTQSLAFNQLTDRIWDRDHHSLYHQYPTQENCQRLIGLACAERESIRRGLPLSFSNVFLAVFI